MPSQVSDGNGTRGTKFLNDLAVQSGRSHIRAQTGYLHLCYHAHPKEQQETIPLVENVLFALALLKTKTSEQVLEARQMLERLLHFQTEGGGFPVYLHQYPLVYDHLIGGDLLPAFYWILAPFRTVLGQELLGKLEKAITLLMEMSLERAQILERLPVKAYKIAASAVALGAEMERQDWKEAGEALIDRWNGERRAPLLRPEALGELIVARQLLDSALEAPESQQWLKEVAAFWDPSRSCYSGPAVEEFQLGLEPEPTLYDLTMSYLHGEFGRRVLADHVVHLSGALIQPIHSHGELFSEQANLHEQDWGMYREPAFACSWWKAKEWKPGSSSLKIVWGDREKLHSAVLELPDGVEFATRRDGQSLTLVLDLPEAEDPLDRKKSREFQVFVDLGDTIQWTVDGVPANTFQLGEEVRWSSRKWSASLSCKLLQGKGDFFGHIMLGNRRGQRLAKGPHLHEAYDWVCFLRRTREHEPCRLEIKLKLGEE